MRHLHRVLAGVGGAAAAAWVMLRRRHYRRLSRELTAAELEQLTPYFGAELLRRVRVACLERIDNPALIKGLMPLGFRPPMDLRNLWGMAFVDTVVLARGSERGGCGVLFHELVHIVQYQTLGTRRFLTQYLLGWLRNGRDYWSIPDEVEAYALTRRFGRGAAFSVGAEVRGRLLGAER